MIHDALKQKDVKDQGCPPVLIPREKQQLLNSNPNNPATVMLIKQHHHEKK